MISRARQLFRVGQGLRRDSVYGRIRTLGLTVCLCTLMVGALGLTLDLSLAKHRGEVNAALQPVPATHRTGSAYVLPQLRTVVDVGGTPQPFKVVWVEPGGGAVDPPLGLAAWPGPGEAVLSPQAAQDLGSKSNLFGTSVGQIDRQGLQSGTERLVYARPTQAALDIRAMQPIGGFGPDGDSSWPGAPTLYAAHTWEVVGTFGLLVFLPGLVGLMVSAQVGAARRRSRSFHLVAMGARRRDLFWMEAGYSWPAFAVSGSFGILIALLAGLRTWHFAALDFTLTPDLVRAWWFEALASVICTQVIALALVLLVSTRHQRLGTRVSRISAQGWFGVPVFIVAAVLAIWIPGQSTSAIVRTVSYHVCVAIVILALPFVTLMVTRSIGRLGMRINRGRPGWLVAGASLSRRPEKTAWLLSGAAAVVLLVGQIQLNVGLLGDIYAQAKSGQEEYGSTALVGYPSRYDGNVDRYVDGLPSGVRAVWIGQPPASAAELQPPPRMYGTCAAITALGLPCTAGLVNLPVGPQQTRQLRAVIAGTFILGSNQVLVRPEARTNPKLLMTSNAALAVFSTNGQDLDVAQVQRNANATILGGLNLDSVGQQWLASGTQVSLRVRWLLLWGAFTLLAMLTALMAAVIALVLDSARELATLAALSERTAWLRALMLLRGWLPMALCGSAAAIGYYILPTGMTTRVLNATYFTPSATYMWTCILATNAIGLGVALWGSRIVARASLTWRPGQSA